MEQSPIIQPSFHDTASSTNRKASVRIQTQRQISGISALPSGRIPAGEDMGSMKKGSSEGGSGGKRGHTNMEHWGYNNEVKESARRRRRLDAKKAVAEVKRMTGATDDARLSVEFDNPKQGWIGIKVSVGEHKFSEGISYTPNGFLLQLASAVSLAFQGQASVAVAHTEPLSYVFVFTPREAAGIIRLEIIEHHNIRRKGGATVFSFEAQTIRIRESRLADFQQLRK